MFSFLQWWITILNLKRKWKKSFPFETNRLKVYFIFFMRETEIEIGSVLQGNYIFLIFFLFDWHFNIFVRVLKKQDSVLSFWRYFRKYEEKNGKSLWRPIWMIYSSLRFFKYVNRFTVFPLLPTHFKLENYCVPKLKKW